MRAALHPSADRKINAEAYEREIGHRSVDRSISDDRRKARCPYCLQRLAVRAATTQRSAHFAHPSDGGFCPSKKPAGEPYLDLTPTNPDPGAARSLKRAFKRNWVKHYRRLEAMVPFLSVREFLSLLDEADEKQIWGHVGLEERWIPYILVLLADFPPYTSRQKDGKPARIYWFRFWFGSKITEIGQLWI
ncbi:hypothetical protein [Inquilinus sp. CAU 1745]|uniref:DUF7830 domain-containing protein n=1 Tax=Inquilinus sp. CAU 1745 TaxID=3140369 RepID=UPI00325B3B40